MLIEFVRKILKACELHKAKREIAQELRELEQKPMPPAIPEFNDNFTGFKWNGCYYMIPREYYLRPVNADTMRKIAQDIIRTESLLLENIDEEEENIDEEEKC